MEHLDDVTPKDLHDVLESIEGKTPVVRVVAAIAYKHGVTQTTLSEWFDVERKTIYNWLTRFDEGDLEAAVHDERRPGRPPKLAPEQFDELEPALHRPPTAVGIDAPAWTTERVRSYISDRFGVEYSRSSCRRLLRSTGLSLRPVDEAEGPFETHDGEAEDGGTGPSGFLWLPEQASE